MIIRDVYDGRDSLFEGDLELALRLIPADARIVSARATVTPVTSTGAEGPSEERIALEGAAGDRGATQTNRRAPDNSQQGWAEVDFHARRTLAEVEGTGLGGTTLLVDLGGIFNEVNANGALASNGSHFVLPNAGPFPLPGLTVSRFRLTVAGGEPLVTAVNIVSVPTNVSLRLGGQAPFWSLPGDLARAATSPDFADVLQAFLDDATAENGFYAVPLTVHSDALSRLVVRFEIEALCRQSALPQGLDEVALRFDHGSVPVVRSNPIEVVLPRNARVIATRGRASGAFGESRIAVGPTGAVEAAATVEISPETSQAQLLDFDEAVPAAAVDLLVAAADPTVRLQLDLVGDTDGKPGGASLLPAPVPFQLERRSAGSLTWVSADLPAELQLDGKSWLVLQSLEGEAMWAARPADAGEARLEQTRDGGLSWRRTAAAPSSSPLAAYFRMRHRPATFRMPLEIEVGAGEKAQRVSLSRFDAQERVDLDLDFAELPQAFNRYLADVAPFVPDGEHLANGDFSQWLDGAPGRPRRIPLPADNSAPSTIVASPDGRWSFALSTAFSDGEGEFTFINLHRIDLACEEVEETFFLGEDPALDLVVHPDGTRGYAIVGGSLAVIDLTSLQVLSTVTELSDLQRLALSPDGRFLYAIGPFVITTFRSLLRFETSRLEEAGPTPISGTPNGLASDLAVSPDGARLYVLFVTEGPSWIDVFDPLRLADPSHLGNPEQHIELSEPARTLELAPGGGTAVVTHPGDGTVSVVDLVRLEASAPIPAGPAPSAIAFEPHGEVAYVAGEDGLWAIDLIHRESVALPQLGAGFSDVAVTPLGDRCLVTEVESNAVLSIPLGVPAEWALTSGRISALGLAAPHGQAALMGFLSEPSALPTAVSQVVPAAPESPYELGFFALATADDAVAEIAWRSDDCRDLRTDQVPIRQGDVKNPSPVVHRRRLTSPPGTAQAEVRFTVPEGSMLLTGVTLRATTEALDDADLLGSAATGELTGWRQQPDTAPAFSLQFSPPAPQGALQPADDGVELRNSGTRPVSLVQTVPARAAQPFALELQASDLGGTSPAAPEGQKAELVLRWRREDATPIGTAIRLAIDRAGFDGRTATGTVPADAVEAEVALEIPAGSAVRVRRTGLSFTEVTVVPVSFPAETTGEMFIRDFQAAWEPGEGPPPPVPAGGLCPPTVPESAAKDDCFCPCCECRRPMKGAQPHVTGAGRPVTAGECPDCGGPLLTFGGRPLAGARPLPATRLPTRPRQVVLPRPRRAAAAPSVPPAPAARPAPAAGPPGSDAADVELTEVHGIGAKRAAQLEERGIANLEDLAKADPRDLESLPMVTAEMAARFIREAAEILAERS